jgi:hypothetical protein
MAVVQSCIVKVAEAPKFCVTMGSFHYDTRLGKRKITIWRLREVVLFCESLHHVAFIW